MNPIDRYLAADQGPGDGIGDSVAETPTDADLQIFARCDAVVALTSRLTDSSDLVWAFDEARELARFRDPSASRRQHSYASWRSPWPAWGVAAALAVALVLSAVPRWRADEPGSPVREPGVTNFTFAPIVVSPEVMTTLAELQPVAVLANALAVDSRSLAVLPFADSVQAAGTPIVAADDIYRQLLGQLARVPGLYLIDASKAAVYATTDLTPEQIAQQLGVRGVLEGRVRADNDGVRVELRFTDAASNETSIDETIVRPAEELSELQADIGSRVLAALTRPVPVPVSEAMEIL